MRIIRSSEGQSIFLIMNVVLFKDDTFNVEVYQPNHPD